MHLCLQSTNVYGIGPDHPADAARTSHIFRVLRRCGFGRDVDEMEVRWNEYVRTVRQRKPRNYLDYNPDQLFVAVMEDVEEATRGFSLYKPGEHAIGETLNLAWKTFLSDPMGYDVWESGTVAGMRQNLLV